MVQLEEYMSGDPVYCEGCDTEFTVTSTDYPEQEIVFCPYCGYNIDEGFVDDEDYEELDLDDEDDD